MEMELEQAASEWMGVWLAKAFGIIGSDDNWGGQLLSFDSSCFLVKWPIKFHHLTTTINNFDWNNFIYGVYFFLFLFYFLCIVLVRRKRNLLKIVWQQFNTWKICWELLLVSIWWFYINPCSVFLQICLLSMASNYE